MQWSTRTAAGRTGRSEAGLAAAGRRRRSRQAFDQAGEVVQLVVGRVAPAGRELVCAVSDQLPDRRVRAVGEGAGIWLGGGHRRVQAYFAAVVASMGSSGSNIPS